MRESIGGAWIISIVVLFIVLFSSYLVVSVNYTKAFKVKNYIINAIERKEGYKTYKGEGDVITASINELNNDSSTEADIVAYLKKTGNFIINTPDASAMENKCTADSGNYRTGGYCLLRIGTTAETYYKVTTYMRFQIPILQISLLIEINGETKPLFWDNSDIDL